MLGAIWTAPNTVLGLFAGAIAFAGGASVHWRAREMAFVFSGVRWGPGGALTLGNVILYTGEELASPCWTYAHSAGEATEPPITLADHERAHVLQYMALGPLFLPLYLLCGGVSGRNRFESAADRYAKTGTGWWPWPR